MHLHLFGYNFSIFFFNYLDLFITHTLRKYLYKIEPFTQAMGRKTVSINVKKDVVLLSDIGMSQHKISRQLKISRRCIRQTIRKFDKYDTVATRLGAGRPKKTTNRQTQLIELEQIRDETNSLTDLRRLSQDFFVCRISALEYGS